MFIKGAKKVISEKIKTIRKFRKQTRSPSNLVESAGEIPSLDNIPHNRSFYLHGNKTSNFGVTSRHFNKSFHENYHRGSDGTNLSTNRSKVNRSHLLSTSPLQSHNTFKHPAYKNVESILNSKHYANSIFVPPLDFNNEKIMHGAREFTSEPTVDNIMSDSTLLKMTMHKKLSMDQAGPTDMIPLQPMMQLPRTSMEKKNKNTFQDQIRAPSTVSMDEANEKRLQKYAKLLQEFSKIESEFDKHDIEISMQGRQFSADSTKYLTQVHSEQEYLKNLLAEISSKFENSELNAFKISLSKTKQSSETKIMNAIYSLFIRLWEASAECAKKLETHFTAVNEVKDYKIDNLQIRLNTAMAHLKRIEEDKIRLKKDVELDLK